MRKLAVLMVLLSAGEVAAEQVLIRARIQNGTRQEPGTAEKVTLYRLEAGMEPIRELGAVTGAFELGDLDVDPALPYLVQVRAHGVNYNELVRFSESTQADLQFTVYDVMSDWDGVAVSLTRVTMERRGDVLRAQTLYVVENRSEPPRTLYDPEGTFRFRLPRELRELRSVTASSASGMPVPQPTELAGDGSTYVTRAPFKPGSTEIVVSYDIDYANEEFEWREASLYDIPTLVVLVSPSDIQVDVDAEWEKLSPGPSSRFLVLRRHDLMKGQWLEASFRGGTVNPTPMSSQSSLSSGVAPHGTVTTIPNPSAPRQAIVVVLMAAALAYGLLAALYGNPSKNS